jgi:hypothetical protein
MALGGYGTWNSAKKFCIRKVIANLSIVSPIKQMVQYVLQGKLQVQAVSMYCFNAIGK